MRAVVLAGGKGTRLYPYTASFPKPLMPVGDVPIMELLLRRLHRTGITDVTVLTGHLAHLIEAYFSDGAALGLHITYIREDRPLGTAGPLRQLVGTHHDDFLVLNGGLFTDLDFGALVEDHRTNNAVATVCTYRRTETVDLGVLHIAADGRVLRYDEKPTLDMDVSMGVYAMSPAVLQRIPDRPYDMPALISDLLACGAPVIGFRHTGLWLDIGRPDDYGLADRIATAHPPETRA